MTHLARRGAAILAVAALAFGAAACGGDDEGGDASTTAPATTAPVTTAPVALTADEFRAQANAVCTDYLGRLDALGEPDSPAEIGPFFAQAQPIYQEFLGRLQAIVPPAELKADYDGALAIQGQLLGLIQQIQSRIAAGEDPTAVATAIGPQIDPLSDQLDQRAQALGLTECISDDDDSGTTTASTPTTPSVETVTTPPATTDATPGRVVDTATFVRDVQAFAQTLTQFGLTLQAAAEGPEALRERSSLLRRQLDEYDAVVARMASYTVDTPQLEQRRAAIVAASPDVSRLGRELLDAAEANDASRVRSVATEFVAALEKLRSAATGG